MPNSKYDFAGWVTKNDIQCADGVTIKHDAFKDNHESKVPLVWNHDYNTPSNVLGYVNLENESLGVYGYGHFNDSEEAASAKELVKHGDISSMSIGARKIKRSGNNITHGSIYEVSLVLSGANPGAMIDSIVTHSDGDLVDEHGIVYPGTLIHTPEDVLQHKKDKEEKEVNDDMEEETMGDVIDSMTDVQKEAMYAIIGMVAEEKEETIKQSTDDKGDEVLKHNVFNSQEGTDINQAKNSLNEAIKHAATENVSSLKETLESYTDSKGDTLTHGINSIEMLFPEAAHPTNGNIPILYKDPNTSYKEILNATTKSPFSRVRTLVADLTEDEARAKGYIKGAFKKEQFFSLIKRTTEPATIYKKQKLDRDDIVDITDFDVVSFMNREMRTMLEEELARAILIGDGREIDDEDKIDEQRIRPVISDNEFFTIKGKYTSADQFTESVIKAMADYRGSGTPSMYIDPTLLADVKLLKGTDGRFIFGDIPSTQSIAARLGLGSIVATSFMIGKGALIVNLKDYTIGASKGGEITNFDDFDIDFNQYKYLIETRVSGCLTMPKSAIHLGKTAGTGASDADAGMTFGDRQADREAAEETPEEPLP